MSRLVLVALMKRTVALLLEPGPVGSSSHAAMATDDTSRTSARLRNCMLLPPWMVRRDGAVSAARREERARYRRSGERRRDDQRDVQSSDEGDVADIEYHRLRSCGRDAHSLVDGRAHARERGG